MKKFLGGVGIVCTVGILLFFSPGVARAATGQIFNMASTTSWNIRFDGPADTGGSGAALSYAAVATGDLCGNGKQDLVVGARNADFNGRQDSGSLYVICNSLWASLAGTGNVIHLASSTSYNLRIDSASSSDSGGRSPIIADFDGDGRNDLMLVSYVTGYNGPNSGSAYLLYNPLFHSLLATTGNTLDLSTSTSYNLRIDGEGADASLTTAVSGDLYGTGKQDLVLLEDGLNHQEAFVIENAKLQNYVSGTGHVIDLASSTLYSLKYTTSNSGDLIAFGEDAIQITDLKGDGNNDLLIGAPGTSYNAANSGSLYIMSHALLSSYGTSTGVIVDLASSTSYSIRMDGSYLLAYDGVFAAGDLDGDGRRDIVVADAASNNSRANSGSVYVAYYSGYGGLLGTTGNVVDLTNPSKFNLRYDGAAANTWIVAGGKIAVQDLDNDGKGDIVIDTATNLTTNPGSVYVIFNPLIVNHATSTTGNTIDLASSTSYNYRYDGAAAGEWLGGFALNVADMDQSGSTDLVLGAWGASNSGSGTGSLYVIYYFPDTLALDSVFHGTSGNVFTVTGSISAPNNPTTIAGVEWSPTGAPGGSDWNDCAARDGVFNSNSEPFSCVIPAASSTRTLYFRGEDAKGIYTASSSYASITLTPVSPISSISSTPATSAATITWTTADPASSIVEYGLAPGIYTASTTESDTSPRVTSHSVSLSGLSCSATYYYRVRSRDAAGNTATSTEDQFTVSACTTIVRNHGGGGGGRAVIFISTPTPPVGSFAPSGTSSVPLPPVPLIVPVPSTFLRNLGVGSIGADVQALQKLLNSQGYLVSPSGAGSIGHESSYFGAKTKAALAKWQFVHHISPAVGYCGPLTRAALNVLTSAAR